MVTQSAKGVGDLAGDVPAVKLSIQILERLARDWPHGVSTAQLVERFGMNRSTCYNILSTLLGSEWVSKLDGRAGWTIGPRIFALTSVRDNSNFADVQSELEALSRQLGFVVFVAAKANNGEYVVIARADRRFGVRVTAEVGDRFPFAAPAILESFEAWTESAELERLVGQYGLQQFTEHSVTGVPELKTILAKVRQVGYSYSVQKFDLAQSGVAAPIFDARARPTLVLCTLGFSTNLNEDNVRDVGARLRETAGVITGRLGGSVPAALEPAAGIHPLIQTSVRR